MCQFSRFQGRKMYDTHGEPYGRVTQFIAGPGRLEIPSQYDGSTDQKNPRRDHQTSCTTRTCSF
jgi:hypothetical protein